MSHKLSTFLGGAFMVIVIYFVTILVYNIYFHPLAGYPGPKQWTSNRFTYVLSIWSGFLARDVRQLHSKYGAFVRIAPDEISIASPDAWHDVYSNTGERDALPKSKLWHSPTPGRPKSILNALEPKDHQRFRRSIEPGLSERALRDQEKVVKSYIGSMITRLEDIVSGNSGAEVVDIVRWFGFTTFDLIGDLGFGESFNCLEGSDFHPWILLIFNSLRAATLNASLRYYPGLNWLLGLAIPKSVMRKQREHWALAADKVNRRLNLEMARPDILSHIKIDDEGISGLTLGEVQATASIIIVAGSETTVSILSGITNYLVKNPIKLAFLTAEIRDRFDSLESMSLSTLKDLEYLNAVIHEGFRLCNPTPVGLPRIVPSGGVKIAGKYIPANTFVNVHPLTISLSPLFFAQPEQFVPERWLPSAAENRESPFYNDQRGAVQVFSVGPRSCPGRFLALAELRLMLSQLVWMFDIQSADTPQGKLHWNEQRVFSVVERQPFEILLKNRST